MPAQPAPNTSTKMNKEDEDGKSTSSSPTIPAILFRIFLVAFLLRFLVALILIGDITDPYRDHWHFAYETGRVARSLATGHGFQDPLFTHTGPTAWLAPVYPLLLAAIFRVFGIFSTASAVVALALNALFASLTIYPLYFLTRKIFGPPHAKVAAWLWDTCLSTLFLTTLIWWTLELESDSPKPLSHWAAYGALWGLTALTNPSLLAALPFLGSWLLYRHLRTRRRILPRLAASAALCILFVSPWLIRNYFVFQSTFMLKSNFWLEMATGNLGSHVHWWNDNQHPGRNVGELLKLQRVGELAYMAEKKSQVLAFVRQNPEEFLFLSARRFVYVWTGFWSFRPDYLVEESLDPVTIPISSTISFAAFSGLFLAFRRKLDRLWPSVFALLSIPLVYYFTHPDITYRHPIDPQIVMFASFAAWPPILLGFQSSSLSKLYLRLRPLKPETTM